MKTALEKILEYKVKDGRVTSQSDKEQWTCLQKIIAINKLIVDYHNAFVELKESYQDLLDRYNVINAEWDVLKTDMEAIASEWKQFKPLVNQIINLWENTITPTFEEWTTLMNNWGNTMNGYASTMSDYQQTMMEISQSFQKIENEWNAITLAVKGEYESETINLTAPISKMFSIDEYNDCILIPIEGTANCLIRLGNTAITNTEAIDNTVAKSFAFKYCGNSGLNALFEWHGFEQCGTAWTDPTDKEIGFFIQPNNYPCAVTIYKRKVPYFSADQSAEVQEAKQIANSASLDATEANARCTILENQADGMILLNFTDAPITGNNSKTFSGINKQAWTHLEVILTTYSGAYVPITIPMVIIEENVASPREFTTSDDLYSGFKASFDSSGLKIQNISTSSNNKIVFIRIC